MFEVPFPHRVRKNIENGLADKGFFILHAAAFDERLVDDDITRLGIFYKKHDIGDLVEKRLGRFDQWEVGRVYDFIVGHRIPFVVVLKSESCLCYCPRSA